MGEFAGMPVTPGSRQRISFENQQVTLPSVLIRPA
jgi:hypothetical protein